MSDELTGPSPVPLRKPKIDPETIGIGAEELGRKSDGTKETDQMITSAPPDAHDALERALSGLSELLQSVGPDDWTRCTPCPAWTVGDVLDHVLTITDKFMRFAAGRTDSPHGQVGHPEDRYAALEAAIAQSRAAWSSVDPRRICRLPFGDFSADEVAAINAADVLIHTWDIARGAGLDYSMPTALVPQALVTIRRLASDEAVRNGHFTRPPAAVRGGDERSLLIASGRSPAWPDGDRPSPGHANGRQIR